MKKVRKFIQLCAYLLFPLFNSEKWMKSYSKEEVPQEITPELTEDDLVKMSEEIWEEYVKGK